MILYWKPVNDEPFANPLIVTGGDIELSYDNIAVYEIVFFISC